MNNFGVLNDNGGGDDFEKMQLMLSKQRTSKKVEDVQRHDKGGKHEKGGHEHGSKKRKSKYRAASPSDPNSKSMI